MKLEKRLDNEVQRIRKKAKKLWDEEDPETTAKWLSIEQEAIFAGICEGGECEKREGTNHAPCFMTAREFASKKYKTCPHCNEGTLMILSWETIRLSINEYDIYQRKYEEKLEQIRNSKETD